MTLKNGSTGEDVKRLQTALRVAADGNFGLKTETALKLWQTANGQIADGIAGPVSLGKLGITTVNGAALVLDPYLETAGLNLKKLRGHVPDAVLTQIPEVVVKFNITTNLRLAHFLSQCAHESGGFKAVTENLNYSLKGLIKTFGKYFSGNLASLYAKQPEKIASRVYANRMGNGDEKSREGWNYRGRGYIQLTGKGNYIAFTEFIGEDCVANPDLVATKYPLASAAFFFNSNKLWAICDKGASDVDVTAVTKRVNGGTNGLADRIKHFKEYYDLLT